MNFEVKKIQLAQLIQLIGTNFRKKALSKMLDNFTD
jgi:hypothetical protein